MRQQHGLTVIELMILVVIVGIALALALPLFTTLQDGANERATMSNMHEVQLSMEGAAEVVDRHGVYLFNVDSLQAGPWRWSHKAKNPWTHEPLMVVYRDTVTAGEAFNRGLIIITPSHHLVACVPTESGLQAPATYEIGVGYRIYGVGCDHRIMPFILHDGP